MAYRSLITNRCINDGKFRIFVHITSSHNHLIFGSLTLLQYHCYIEMKILITPAVVAALLSLVIVGDAFVPISSRRASLQAASKITDEPLTRKSRGRSNSVGLRMAAYPTIDEWQIVSSGGIKGTVIDSPIADIVVGEIITTSKIVTNRGSVLDGTIVETASGSRYILGTKKFAVGTRKIAKKAAPAAAVVIPTLDSWELTPAGEINGAITNYNGNNFEEGEEITTSPLSNKRGIKDGSVVTTISGSKYKLGAKKSGNGQGTLPNRGTRPIVNKAVVEEQAKSAFGGFNFFGSKEEPEVIEEIEVDPFPEPAPSPVPSFGFFSNKQKDDIIEDINEVVNLPPKVEKKRPAPFGSVGRGVARGVGRAVGRTAPPPVEIVPIIDNWVVNNRDQVIGIVSNSLYDDEKDGTRISTGEVATNMEFVEQGFTVLTMDDRKYKLGVPKGGKKDYNDEMASYITPALFDWDVDADLKITGNIDGTFITTDKVISDFEFISDGFTVCTESGRMYKLENRKKGRRPVANSPKITLPKVSIPKVSNQEKQSSGTITASGKVPEASKKARSTPFLNFGSSGGKATNKPKKVTLTNASIPSLIPTLEEWTVSRTNQITGVVTNSLDRDGETLTTSALSSKGGLREGSTVYTKSGSGYILGRRKAAAAAFGRTNAQTEAIALPILNDWAVTVVGGVSGFVTNCPNPDVEDGEILTTSKLETSDKAPKSGDTVVTINGSKYVLGSQRPLGVKVESPPTPVLAGIWVIAVILFVILND